jgi:hypothetical protein
LTGVLVNSFQLGGGSKAAFPCGNGKIWR